MTMIKWFFLAALAAALAVPYTRPVIAGEFADALDTPALRSELAAHAAGELFIIGEQGLPLSITTGSVTLDGRIILVSQAGHVLVSVDDGSNFHLQPNSAMGPVAAAQVAGVGSLVLAGARGLRQLPLE